MTNYLTKNIFDTEEAVLVSVSLQERRSATLLKLPNAYVLPEMTVLSSGGRLSQVRSAEKTRHS
jgi:hypothetical protein